MEIKKYLFRFFVLLSIVMIGIACLINVKLVHPASSISDWLNTVYWYHITNYLFTGALFILLICAIYHNYSKNRKQVVAMNWLKNELKFNGILFWIIFLIIGLILAVKEITFVMLCYSSIMLVGCVLTRVGKHYNKDFAKPCFNIIQKVY